MIRLLIVIALIVLLALVGGAVYFAKAIDYEPNIKATATTMTETHSRINGFLQTKKRLPKTLDELLAWQGKVGPLNDGWDRPLIYTLKDGGFLLLSYGRAGVAGGSGPDEDHFIHQEKPRTSN